MARYLVKRGYCLHLPHGRYAHPGEEVDLAGELEREVLEQQGWKVELVQPQPAAPEEREVDEPPRNRTIKKAKTK